MSGRWEVSVDVVRLEISGDKSGDAWMPVGGAPVGRYETEAEARTVAMRVAQAQKVVPELLASLKAMTAMAATEWGEDNKDVERARAAIAEAEGET